MLSPSADVTRAFETRNEPLDVVAKPAVNNWIRLEGVSAINAGSMTASEADLFDGVDADEDEDGPGSGSSTFTGVCVWIATLNTVSGWLRNAAMMARTGLICGIGNVPHVEVASPGLNCLSEIMFGLYGCTPVALMATLIILGLKAARYM